MCQGISVFITNFKMHYSHLSKADITVNKNLLYLLLNKCNAQCVITKCRYNHQYCKNVFDLLLNKYKTKRFITINIYKMYKY